MANYADVVDRIVGKANRLVGCRAPDMNVATN